MACGWGNPSPFNSRSKFHYFGEDVEHVRVVLRCLRCRMPTIVFRPAPVPVTDCPFCGGPRTAKRGGGES